VAGAGEQPLPCHFGRRLLVSAMSLLLLGQLASLPPRTLGCWQRTTTTFPPSPGRGPSMPSPSVWKKGPRLPPRLPQETRSLEVRGQPAAPPEGAKQPSAGACTTPERRGGRQNCGKGGRGPGFSCLCDYQTPKKGKGLGKLVALGQAPASICLVALSLAIASLGQGTTPSPGKRASSSRGSWGYIPGTCKGPVLQGGWGWEVRNDCCCRRL